ncbi:MAG TPA: hypothetical protein VNX17_03685 [Edaphobacter sp.]|nr:hypothetical protein [Edaphobacter sp.]
MRAMTTVSGGNVVTRHPREWAKTIVSSQRAGMTIVIPNSSGTSAF